MSAISFSNNYVSSNYYASAKGQRAASTETVNNNNEIISPAGDTLTISAEALEALNNSGEVLTISAEKLEEKEMIIFTELKRTVRPKPFNYKEYQAKIAEHSNHRSLKDWAFSIASKKEYNEITTYNNKTQADNAIITHCTYIMNVELGNSRRQSSFENADEIFAELLKKNNIKLNENESVELSIDYDGKITVGGNLNKEKSELIQNALNNNKSLGQNLLMAHVPLVYSDEAKLIQVNMILQQEYGLSLSDFELNEDYKPMEYIKTMPTEYKSLEELESYFEPYNPHERLKIKNGNDALLEELYDSELTLFGEIVQLLLGQRNNPDEELPSTTFSYQNGVFVEEGKNDAVTLNSFASKAAKMWLSVNRVDYSMTFNNNGEIIDVTEDKTQTRNFSKPLKETILQYNRDSLGGDTLAILDSGSLGAQVLQQYAFDKKRLTQYETGANASDLDTFTVGKNEKGNFSIASNSTLLRQIIKSTTENPAEKIILDIPRRYGR
jgi:hypothetical protein